METKKALIIGCGVAGPVVAMFLRRAGVEAEIFEAQPAPDDYSGLFLNLASNGRAVLASLGIDEQLAAVGFACPRMVMWSGSGKRLGEMPNGATAEQGAPSMIMRRGDLHRVVREQARSEGIPITFGKQLASIALENSQQVVATFTDGSRAQGDFLIGCDGLHSRVRQIIDTDAPAPSYTGLVSCGGYVRNTTLAPTPGTQHFVFGEKGFFGYLVKDDGEVYWFSNMAYPGTPRRAELEAIPHEQWRQRLLDLHQNDQPFIGELLRATEGPIGRYPVYDIPKLPRWRAGPLVLIGDAAHATSPSAGQGASLALEDAIVLAQCVRDIPRIDDAFAAYERLRRARAEKVVQASRRTGNNKAVSSPLARWFRDLMMPIFIRLLACSNGLAWLYSYRIAWEENTAGSPAPVHHEPLLR